MSEYTEEKIYEKEMTSFDKIYFGFLLGMGAIIGLWLASGLLYVILK